MILQNKLAQQDSTSTLNLKITKRLLKMLAKA